jgi:tRNA(Ile)-lysidine synthase TilS/MesJ
LCSACFSTWVENRSFETIENEGLLLAGDRVLVCCSGEKDSVVMLDLIAKYVASRDLDVELIVLTVDEGISDYRKRCTLVAERHAKERGLRFVQASYWNHFDLTLDDIFARRTAADLRMCQYCCSMRGTVVRDQALSLEVNKIATGTNLTDAAEYAVMCILNGNIDNKCLPIHIPPGASISFISPILGLTGYECWLYAYLNKLEHLFEDCRHCAEHFHDDLRSSLSMLEDKNPGVMEKLYLGYRKILLSKESVSPGE